MDETAAQMDEGIAAHARHTKKWQNGANNALMDLRARCCDAQLMQQAMSRGTLPLV